MGFFDTISSAFSRDGAATKFTEKIPVVGLVTAGVQAIAGNGDHAKRALATSLNATLTTAGTVGGFMVGGPVGAVAGGAAASCAGIGVEWGVSKTIDDQSVKGNVGDTSLSRFAIDGTIAGVTGMFGGGGSSAVAKQVGAAFSTEIGKSAAKQAGMSLVKSAAYASIGQVAQAMVDTALPGKIDASDKDPGQQSQPSPPVTGTQEQTQSGQFSTPPKPHDPTTEDDKKDPKKEPVRAISANQAAAGFEYCRLLALAEQNFKAFGETSPVNPQPLTVDLCGQYRQLHHYFVPNVLHVETMNMWDGLVAELRNKLAIQKYATKVKQAILSDTKAQADPQWATNMTASWDDIVSKLLVMQASLVDSALECDAYMVAPEQIVPAPEGCPQCAILYPGMQL